MNTTRIEKCKTQYNQNILSLHPKNNATLAQLVEQRIRNA